MNRVILLTLIVWLPFTVAAQPDFNSLMNTESFWKHLSFNDYKGVQGKNKLPMEPASDTMIVVASNRIFQPDKVRFMSEERGSDHLNYFVVFVKNGQWNVWRTDLRSAIATMKPRDRDWVIYTEGFGKIFTTGLFRGLAMSTQHNVNVLYLDYPSYSTSKKIMGNYYFASVNAKMAGDDFMPVLRTVKSMREKEQMGKGHLSLFFHSMGNNVIREMALSHLLKEVNETVWIDNLILNAPCVPSKNHAAWVDQIRLAQRIYINYNPKDNTLAGANFMSLQKQLGQEIFYPLSKQAVYINFNQLANRAHSNFMQLPYHLKASPVALQYYYALLHGNEVHVDNTAQFGPSEYHKIGYTILGTPLEAIDGEKISAGQSTDSLSGGIQPPIVTEDKPAQKGSSGMVH